MSDDRSHCLSSSNFQNRLGSCHSTAEVAVGFYSLKLSPSMQSLFSISFSGFETKFSLVFLSIPVTVQSRFVLVDTGTCRSGILFLTRPVVLC